MVQPARAGDRGWVLDPIDELLDAHLGVCSRDQLLNVLSPDQLRSELRRGLLERVAPSHFARPWRADDGAIRELAAVRSAGAGAALSHLSALRRYDLLVTPTPQIHITTPVEQRVRSRGHVVVHRTRRPIDAITRGGARTVRPARAIVDSWPLLAGSDRRAPAIRGVAQRIVTPEQLRTAAQAHVTLPAHTELLRLIELLEAGCRSELELWGYLKVFRTGELRGAVRQRPVVVRGKTYYLDMAYERQQVCVELDGRAYHSSSARWESDIARDLALATLGWQTIRLSHRRLTSDVEGCRRDVRQVLARRRSRPSAD